MKRGTRHEYDNKEQGGITHMTTEGNRKIDIPGHQKKKRKTAKAGEKKKGERRRRELKWAAGVILQQRGEKEATRY